MIKQFTLTAPQADWLKTTLWILGVKTDKDVFLKLQVWGCLKPLEAWKNNTDAEKSENITFQLELESLDWLRAEWKKIPGLYKRRNDKGDILQDGLTSERECAFFLAVKDAFDSASVVPAN